jgi:predicted phosphodiesterase
MRTAFISDIHSNLEALKTVLADIEKKNVDSVICLGDIIGYGSNPNECVDLIREKCDLCIMGNHDSAVFAPSSELNFNSNALYAITWTSKIISRSSLTFLNDLHMTYETEDYTAVHSTPYDPYQWFYIASIEDALFNFNFFKTKFCFNGHTHVPGIIALNNQSGNIKVYKEKSFRYNPDPEYRYIINVGSVGQPRDGDNRACYAILDTGKKIVEYHRTAYNIQTYQDKMQKSGMPDFLIRRIELGK